MGLDLYLMTKAEYNRAKDERRGWDHYCYGRKTWTIYDFFAKRAVGGNDDWEIELDYYAIKDFVDLVKPYYENLKKIIDLLEVAEYADGDYKLTQDADLLKARFLRDWCNAGGNDDFTLGQAHELKAIIKWYEILKDEVKLYLPRKRYIMIASY